MYAADDARAWGDQARRAADLGYTSLHLPDHLGGQFSPLPALAAAAAAAPGLRVGTLVLNCAIHHPVVLAKELATVDVLTKGRLQVGIGAGWQRTDFDRTGADRLAPAARVRRLIEFVSILDALWRGAVVTHHGEYYDVTDARCLPAPVTRPLPLLIGGGSAAILRFAGATAQAVGLDVPQPAGRFDAGTYLAAAGTTAFRDRAGWARQAGRDVELVMQIPAGLVALDARPADVAARWGVATDVVTDSPLALVGDVAEVADRLTRWRAETGVSRIVVPGDAMADARPLVEKLAGR